MPSAATARHLGRQDSETPSPSAHASKRTGSGTLLPQPLRREPLGPSNRAQAQPRMTGTSGTPSPPAAKANGPRRSGIPRRVSQAASLANKRLILNETDDEENDDKENSQDVSGDLTLTDLRGAGPPPVAPSRANASHANSKSRGAGVASALSKSRMASSSAARRGGDVSSGPSSDVTIHPPSANDLASSRRAGGVTALARSHGPRRSLGASLNAAAVAGGAAHEGAAKEVVKLNVDSTSFEEWMKMATDNKINATNTWSFALIDYFHDMSLLRSDTGDGTINFQKASCTLDGCIKVWTSRVDSVVVETGKLLSGLQDDVDGKKGRSTKEGEEEDGEEGEEDEEGGSGGKKKKRSKAKEATLVKSFNQIAAKRLDLEFTVDPLFKKTSADFDEGGAGGLLMNHLGVDGKVRIVFDAGDVAGVTDGAEEPVAEDGSDREKTPVPEVNAQPQKLRPEDFVDLNSLRVTLFGEDEAVYAEGDSALGTLINHRTVCPTFSAFRFAADDDTPFGALASHSLGDEGEQQPDVGLTGSMPPDSVEGDFAAFDDAPDNFGGDGADFFGSGGGEGDEGEYDDIFASAAAGQGARAGLNHGGEADEVDLYGEPGPSGQLGTGPTGLGDRGLQLAFRNPEEADGEAGAEGDMFDYFDRQLTKNWAGPEHWKMRKGVFGSLASAGKDGEGASPAAKVAKKVKEPFVIDFTSPEGAVSSAHIFEAAKGGAGIMLPRTQQDDLHLLPEDRHFSSRELLRLAIKPRAVLNLRRRGARVAQVNESDLLHPADVDEQFWAAAAAEREHNLAAGGEYDADAPGQYDDDDGAFDAMDGGDVQMDLAEAEEEGMLLPTQALKKIRPEMVNYAKKAKRVDVKRLKDNIWKELALELVDDLDAEASTEDEAGPSTPGKADRKPIVKQEPRTFATVMDGLKKSYTKDRLEEISTSFCFICLLHLANEEGLTLQPNKEEAASRGGGAYKRETSPSLSTAKEAARAAAGRRSDGLDDQKMHEMFDRLKAAGAAVHDDDDDEEEDEDEDRIHDGDDKDVAWLYSLNIHRDPTVEQ